jgi:hypothetical protein
LYFSPNIIRLIKSRRMGWVEHVAHMGEMRNVYKILTGKPEWTRPLKRLKMDLKGNWVWGCGLDLAQDRDWWQAPVNMVMNLWVP